MTSITSLLSVCGAVIAPLRAYFTEEVMRRLMMAALLGLALGSMTGCLLPAFSGDQATRVGELQNVSEDGRNFLSTWQRFWFLDQPDHSTPLRTHGGII